MPTKYLSVEVLDASALVKFLFRLLQWGKLRNLRALL
jgi:hypothetical protein